MTVQAHDELTASQQQLLQQIRASRAAAGPLATLSGEARNQILLAMARAIEQQATTLLRANETDLLAARERGLSDAMIDRLALNAARLDALSSGLRAVAALPDPL